MNVHDYRFLLSERGALNKLIAECSPDEVITRMSFQARLADVEEKLEDYEGFSSKLVDAHLTFQGVPVEGSRGIWAEFGSRAVKDFTDAVAKVGASLGAGLSPKGPVPEQPDHRLLITGTVVGSFGFQLESASQQLALPGESTPTEIAIEQVKSIMEASTGTDEQLADAIADTDQRALKAIGSFLKTVADDMAVCALEYRGDLFRFRDVEQVRRSQSRLSEDISEDDVSLRGHFQGFLPKQRRAEFYIDDTEEDYLQDTVGTVIAGSVERTVTESSDINQILQREITINARARRVGSGKPRFTITRLAG